VNRSTLARRYAPIVGLAVLQLLIIGFVPSKAAKNDAAQVATRGGAAASGATSSKAGATGPGGATTPGAAVSGPAGAAVAGPAGSAGTGGGATDSGAPPGAEASGDTSHCVNGREFDPAIAYWAPPCVPGTPGAAGGNNGGATYQGVSGDTITLIDYISNYGAEVNAILQAQGTLLTYEDAKVLDTAWMNFINTHYVLYGRKVNIVTYQGKCQSVPPDYPCLISEMDSIVATYSPYAVNWQTTLCSACYQELARLKVVAVGGTGFSDSLAGALAPFFYGAGESSTRVEQAFAELYCSQMTGPVKFAGHQNPAQDFNGKPRVLGIISTNDPDNEDTVLKFLVPLLKQTCGVTVDHFYFYDQDINTAAKQVAAGIAAMDTLNNPATTVLCLCDQVAPAFLFDGEQSNNYYPENVIATNQQMDIETTGQSYGPNDDGSGSLGCPSPQLGCEYDLAFGISIVGAPEPQDNTVGVRIFKDGSGGGALPGGVTGINASLIAQEWIMLANLIEAAGPNLTPDTMAAQAASLGNVGSGTDSVLGFSNGSGYWTQDARLVYWNRNQPSPYNGKKGTYVQVGDRVNLGGWGSARYADIPEVRS
jgi:hypothetical protein